MDPKPPQGCSSVLVTKLASLLTLQMTGAVVKDISPPAVAKCSPKQVADLRCVTGPKGVELGGVRTGKEWGDGAQTTGHCQDKASPLQTVVLADLPLTLSAQKSKPIPSCSDGVADSQGEQRQSQQRKQQCEEVKCFSVWFQGWGGGKNWETQKGNIAKRQNFLAAF